jgi:hypothetical protein
MVAHHSFRPFSRSNGASSLRSRDPISDDTMALVAPSIFAVSAHESRSARYTQIPTSQVLAGLRSEGFFPFAIAQSGARDESKRAFTRHMIRLRREGQAIVGDSHPEIILVNSHDGTSAYHMHFGWFRLVCSNGMVVADGPSSEIKVRHSGNAELVLGEVVAGAHQLVASVEQQAETVDVFRTTRLLPAEATLLADAAIDIRFDERRNADGGSDLWSVTNRIQENLVQGGLSWRDRGRRHSSRAVTSIAADTKLNQAIWTLASKMAEIKGASL